MLHNTSLHDALKQFEVDLTATDPAAGAAAGSVEIATGVGGDGGEPAMAERSTTCFQLQSSMLGFSCWSRDVASSFVRAHLGWVEPYHGSCTDALRSPSCALIW